MIEPERIPEAVLRHRPLAWKAYFWFLFVVNLVLIIFLVYEPEAYGAAARDYVDLAVSSTALVGLFGYCYQKRVATRNFWKILFPVMFASDTFQILSDDWTGPEELKTLMIGIAVMLVVVFPLYIAIYRYGFKDDIIWSGTNPLNPDGDT